MLPALQFPVLIERCFGPAEAFCNHLLGSLAEFARREDLSDEAVARLEEHRGRYTMQREHDEHAAAIGAPAPAAGTPAGLSADSEPSGEATGAAAPSAEGAAGALGDGIELF
jgi:hypothetical protein